MAHEIVLKILNSLVLNVIYSFNIETMIRFNICINPAKPEPISTLSLGQKFPMDFVKFVKLKEFV